MKNLRNPIYLEYYHHLGCYCFKIDLPFTNYASEKLVLCREDEGYDRAKELAKVEIQKRIDIVFEFGFNNPVEKN